MGTPDDQRRQTRERHQEIVRLLRSGTTQVENLALRVGVSESTVRRDLARLERQGVLSRTYGGARANLPFRETSVGERLARDLEPKALIGAAAAAWVRDGATIFIDAGSTCAQLVAHIYDRKDLTVVTRGLEIAVLLADSPVELILIGGKVSPKSHGMTGAITLFVMERLSVDVAFLGCDAVDATKGVGEPTLEEAATKEMIARHSRQVVVLAHAAKLAETNVPAWARLAPNWTLLTDEHREDALGPFRTAGVDVVTVTP